MQTGQLADERVSDSCIIRVFFNAWHLQFRSYDESVKYARNSSEQVQREM